MAKGHGRKRRKFRQYIKGRIDFSFLLGTLGAKVVISGSEAQVAIEKAWLSSIVCTHTMQNFTKAGVDGPITIGVAHSDYTNAEIEAWLENQGSWDRGNMVQQEINKRKIRLIGTFAGPADAGRTAELNEGRPIRTKCGWQLLTGDTVRIWAYNEGSSALAGTDPVVSQTGYANLWPN